MPYRVPVPRRGRTRRRRRSDAARLGVLGALFVGALMLTDLTVLLFAALSWLARPRPAPDLAIHRRATERLRALRPMRAPRQRARRLWRALRRA